MTQAIAIMTSRTWDAVFRSRDSTKPHYIINITRYVTHFINTFHIQYMLHVNVYITHTLVKTSMNNI